jgi:pimeloyl-ACP methyl ester carboxylesterase
MPSVRANGIELEYEALGDAQNPPLLMIAGLGAQLVTWDDEFCAGLAGAGFWVIRFDNRDAGLSSKLDHLGPPKLDTPAYSLADMADDAAALLDALGLGAAHVVGASMGGMIAQQLAIRHPARVMTLTSIMSSPGGEDVVPPTPEAAQVVFRPPAPDREAEIELSLWAARVLAGPANDLDLERERRRVMQRIERGFHPDGTTRQLAALLSTASTRQALGRLRIPVLVVHGEDDPLVPIENGVRTAAAIPGARLLRLPKMGHNMPPASWPVVIAAIAELATAASVSPEASARSAPAAVLPGRGRPRG